MAANSEKAAEVQTRADAVRARVRRSSVGRALVAVAVFAPALLILGSFLRSGGSIYSRRFTGPWWPWVLVDVVLLVAGMRLMRGEDL